MRLRLVTAPAAAPVSLEEAKAHLKIEHSDDDGRLQMLLDAAIQHVDGPEGVLNRVAITQTWALDLSRFPVGILRFPLSPLASVAEVSFVTPDGERLVLDASNYEIEAGRYPTFQRSVDGAFPATATRVDAVTIKFVVGETITDRGLRVAILQLLSDLNSGRTGEGSAFDPGSFVGRSIMRLRYMPG